LVEEQLSYRQPGAVHNLSPSRLTSDYDWGKSGILLLGVKAATSSRAQLEIAGAFENGRWNAAIRSLDSDDFRGDSAIDRGRICGIPERRAQHWWTGEKKDNRRHD
jgi:hypothetical protein